MKLLTKLQSSKEFWFLLITSVIFFFLRLPSLFEPYWYGDEGIYEVIGFALRHGRLLYSGIWDNKPPMLYLIYALFNGDQTLTRSLSLLAGLVAVWAIFFLSKKLFGKFLPAAITTGIFALLFAIPYIEGNIANAENFMLLLNILAGLLVYKTIKLKQKNILHTTYYLLLAGLLLGLSFLTKVVALFDFFAFAVFLVLVSLPNFSFQTIFAVIKKLIPYTIGFLVPVIICVLFFVFHHSFSIFLRSTLFSNVSYVNYGNQFIIPQGFLILKTLLVAIVVLAFLVFRKKIAAPTLFIFLWIAFSLYAALFSGRPYTHYALVILPSISLLVGILFANKKLRIINAIALTILVIFIYNSFTFYSHTTGYYQNFLQYLLGQKTTVAYQSFFDRIVPRDYALAGFITTHRQDNQTIFIWGNSGQLYKLTNTLPPGRFIVEYHMTMTPQNLAETRATLTANPPTYIILLPKQDPIPYSLANYRERLILGGATIYENIF